MQNDYSKAKIAKSIIEEYTVDGVCTLSKKKLGELLHHRHPDLFISADSGRSMIRYVTGSYGEYLREKAKTRIDWKGFKLPEQEKNDYSKVIVNEKRIGILSDIHFPYADLDALNAALEYIYNFDPDCIILLGDVVDFYHASSFERNPNNRSIKYEIDVCRNFLGQLRDQFPDCRIIFKEGNHEERYERKILQKLPEFIDLDWTLLENALGLKEFNIEIVKNKRLIKAGHLNIAHGHEFAKGFIAPVNVARGFYLKSKANVIAGHHHRTSEHFEQDLNGKLIGAWSAGCLCELTPHYQPINNWNHGFAVVEIEGDDFTVHNKKIIKGKVL